LALKVYLEVPSDRCAVERMRRSILDSLSSTTVPGPLVDKGWPVRYVIRRVVWHVLDHTWEIEDRSADG
jgi:hypothetical protein